MAVPFYENQQEIMFFQQQWKAQLKEIIQQTELINGSQVDSFEREMEQFTGIKNAIAVGNGTDALIIGLTAAGVGVGDEVIVPCYSFFASVSCILHVGATPVFVDIEAESYAMNSTSIEAAITPKTKAIMPVHLFCQMADMPSIREVAERHQLLIFEDSAEAIGMYQNGVHAGGFGLGGVLSFFPPKTLGALGDAGMILTNNDKFAKACRQLGNLGRDESGIAQRIGFNSRMDEWHAMVLRSRFSVLEENIQARSANSDYLTTSLNAQAPMVKTPIFNSRGYDANRVDYVYLIEVDNRDALAQHLALAGITTETYYPIPLHMQPICRHLGYRQGDFPVAEKASTCALGLPMHAEMQQHQLDDIVQCIQNFYKE